MHVNWHNIKMIGFWVCVAVVGILQALQGQAIGDFTTIIALLGFLEHYFQGNSSSTI